MREDLINRKHNTNKKFIELKTITHPVHIEYNFSNDSLKLNRIDN